MGFKSFTSAGRLLFLLGSRGCLLNIHSEQPLEKTGVRNKMGLRSVDRCRSLIIYSWSSGEHQHRLCGKALKGDLQPRPPSQALPASLQMCISISQLTQPCLDLPSPSSSALFLGSLSEHRLSISSLPSLNPCLSTPAVCCPRRNHSRQSHLRALDVQNERTFPVTSLCSWQRPARLAVTSFLKSLFFAFLASVTSLSRGSVTCAGS